MFRVYEPGYFLDFHTAPRRQYSITLTGEFEVGTPDGTVKHYGAGTVLLAEDLTGTGHSHPGSGNRATVRHHHSAVRLNQSRVREEAISPAVSSLRREPVRVSSSCLMGGAIMTTYATLSGEFNPTVPSRVIFGQGKAGTLGAEIATLGGRRALVLSGRTVAEQTDTVQQVHAALGDRAVGVYSGLTQRAPLSTAVEAANLAISLGADTLVGVGGSTISDAARMIAVLMAEGISTVEELQRQGHEQGMMMRPNLDGKVLLLQVSIPTTLSAGEFNMGGGNVLDDSAGHKIRVGHPRLYADLIVLDPGYDDGNARLAVAVDGGQGHGPLHRAAVLPRQPARHRRSRAVGGGDALRRPAPLEASGRR